MKPNNPLSTGLEFLPL